ncbi:MAG: DUF2163 domain-containing protein [Pseudomonadota bacterium]
MRTALWETSPGALVALLNARAPIECADLYTVTLADGTVYRWSGSDVAITGNGHTWQLGPGIERTRLKWTVGVSVDTMGLTLADSQARPVLINGKGLLAFIAAGGLIGARVQVDRAFWGFGDPQPVGALLWFTGRVAEVNSVTRWEASLNVKSDLELLDVMVPRDVYQPGCLNTLYDSACGTARASFTVNGTATTATNARRTRFGHNLAQQTGHFDLGVVTFTSGANAGVSRTVRVYNRAPPYGLTGNRGVPDWTIDVLNPWPFAVGVGDAYSIYPGCDKTLATCTWKFNNTPRFRGQPYIPVPETVL